jgi:hypothetical protein
MTIHSIIVPGLNRVVKPGHKYPVNKGLKVTRELTEATVHEVHPPTEERPRGLLKCNIQGDVGKLPTWQEFEPQVINAIFVPGYVFACEECDVVVPEDKMLCAYHQRQKDERDAKLRKEKMDALPENVTGFLDNWYVEPLSAQFFMLHGEMYYDRRNRFLDGTPVHTSRIAAGTRVAEGVIVNTLNSVYKLGKQAEFPPSL